MLVLVSFGLVLLATILLVVGLLNDDGLTLIYLSIGASATAAIVLYVAFRRARPKKDPDAATAPAPLAEDLTVGDEPTTVSPAAPPAAPAVASTATADPGPGAAAPATDDDWMSDAEWETDDEVDFPIADYDDLTVAEIMPLLPQLYSDELDEVIEWERAGKNRSTIITRLEELKEIGTDADAEAETDGPLDEPAEPPAETPAAVPAPAPPATPTRTTPSLLDPIDDDDEILFPIADYDDLSVSQIVPLLSQLEADELAEVREREQSGANRKTLIGEIDRLLPGGAPTVDAPPAPTPAPAEKPAAKKSAPKKAAAKKAPAKKAAAKKATAKKSATKKAAAKKSTAKKSAKRAKKATKAARFPIANYDELNVADIRPRLSDLSDRQLEQVRERELAGAGRKTILKDIDAKLG